MPDQEQGGENWLSAVLRSNAPVAADSREFEVGPGSWSEFEERFGGILLCDPDTGEASNDPRDGDLVWEDVPAGMDVRHVWTVQESWDSNDELVRAGVHRLNRVGYVITICPWTGDPDAYRPYQLES